MIEKWKVASIIFLGLAIIIGSANISQGLKHLPVAPATNMTHVGNSLYEISQVLKEDNSLEVQKDIMTMTETAAYMNLYYIDLKRMIEEQNSTIPYVKIDEQYIFHKKAIEEWMMENQHAYITK